MDSDAFRKSNCNAKRKRGSLWLEFIGSFRLWKAPRITLGKCVPIELATAWRILPSKISEVKYGGGVKMSDRLNEISPAAVLLGREIVSVDTESGEVRLRFLADRQFSNRHGTVQGGMLAAMLDSAAGNAVIANLPSDRTAVTTRLDTTFVKPAALGPLTAIARLVKLDDRSASAEAELIDGSGQVVARARAELRVRERKEDIR
jgi:uncharacterized protein (TIGR00369 family)